MSELVAMRQRMKAIETIKKVTHAMRLISMSMHARLRTKKIQLDEYKQGLINLIQSLTTFYPEWKHSMLSQADHTVSGLEVRPLIVIIGSQKGLCGNFNTNLSQFMHKEVDTKLQEKVSTIVVGKKAVDNATLRIGTVTIEFPEFTQGKLLHIAQNIADHIWHAQIPYSSVVLYYNWPKTFFLQQPTSLKLIPFDQMFTQIESTIKSLNEAYRWEQEPEVLLDLVAHKLIQSVIQSVLFESLIAEQAARFVAMDNSTRNAANLLDAMRLTYNKTRQAKITRELTDLVASFQDNLSA